MEGGGSKLAEGDAVQMLQPLCGAQGPQTPLRVAGGGRQQLSAPLQLALHDGVMEVHPATLRLGRLPHQHRAVHLPCPQTSALQRHRNPHQHNPRKRLPYNSVISPQKKTFQRHHIAANTYLTTSHYIPTNTYFTILLYLQTPTLQRHYLTTNTYFTTPLYSHKHVPTLQRHYIPTNTYLTMALYLHKHLLYNSIISTQTPALHHIPTNTYFTIPSYQHKHVPYNAIRSPQTPAFQLCNNSPKHFFQLFLFYKSETERGPERSCRISNAN